jgi:hypothetical protein
MSSAESVASSGAVRARADVPKPAGVAARTGGVIRGRSAGGELVHAASKQVASGSFISIVDRPRAPRV